MYISNRTRENNEVSRYISYYIFNKAQGTNKTFFVQSPSA